MENQTAPVNDLRDSTHFLHDVLELKLSLNQYKKLFKIIEKGEIYGETTGKANQNYMNSDNYHDEL